jgi:hypothetical protein
MLKKCQKNILNMKKIRSKIILNLHANILHFRIKILFECSQYVSTWILSNYIDLKNLKSIFGAIPTDHGHVVYD